MKKKVLSLLLAAVMLMTTLSVATFADEADNNVLHIDNTSKYGITLDRELAAPVWESSDTGVLTVVRTGRSKLGIGDYVKVNYWVEVKAVKTGSAELSLGNDTTGELVGTVTVRVIEHDYAESTVVASTCVDEGYTLHSCTSGACNRRHGDRRRSHSRASARCRHGTASCRFCSRGRVRKSLFAP